MSEALIGFAIVPASTAIASQGTVTTAACDVRRLKDLALEFKLASSGIGSVQAQIVKGIGATADTAAYGAAADNNDIVSDTNMLSNPLGPHSIEIPDPHCDFVKILFTGLSTNDASTTITAARLVGIEKR